MNDHFVPRVVSFEYDRKIVRIDASTVLTDSRLSGRPLILLGEAGSGKTELLRQWAGEKETAQSVLTARQILSGRKLTGSPTFIDGLDEAASLKGGDALELVLNELEAKRITEFVIACRVADWRSATGTAAIKGWTGVDPIELSIEPLGHPEIVAFLQSCRTLSFEDAEELYTYYQQRGLQDWLGNPQTLQMIATAESAASRPETTSALFDFYIEKAWIEPRRQDTPLATANKKAVLDALGALFAALIVGGYDAITIAPGANRRNDDLALAECKVLPGVAGLSDNQLYGFLNCRLVSGAGKDRFTYQHRRIGEYLGARWLAAHAKSDAVQSRLLAALRHQMLVPSNLRGIWGWLAQSPSLAPKVVRYDPLSVIEYADADSLTPSTARELLHALELAEDERQTFGWRDYRAASLIQPDLQTDVLRVLATSSQKRFWTQLILLEQMRTQAVVSQYGDTLLAIMLDESRPYAIRTAAADALAMFGTNLGWKDILTELVNGTVRESLRLALHLMRASQVGIAVSDLVFAEAIYAYSGLTPRFSASHEIGTIGVFCYNTDKYFRDHRLDGILDALADCADRYDNEDSISEKWEVQKLFLSILRRRLELPDVDCDRLWVWLNSEDLSRFNRRQEEAVWLDDWLKSNPKSRQKLQRKVLDGHSAKNRSLRWKFMKLPLGLYPTSDELVMLLDALPEGDERWKDLLWMAVPRAEGRLVRKAAERHVKTDEDRELLSNHEDPKPKSEDEEHTAWEEQIRRERREERERIRSEFQSHQEQMRSGDWRALVGPARVYMGRTTDVEPSIVPQERLTVWFGADLQEFAFAGFERFLTAAPAEKPFARDIAESHAVGRVWHSALILSAALAERLRNRHGFEDIPTERVQAGLFGLLCEFLDNDEWRELSEALISELERRGAWIETACLFIEPQLRKRCRHVTWLWRVLSSRDGANLAAKWLKAFPKALPEAEEALIDKLMQTGDDNSIEVLRLTWEHRKKQKLSVERRSIWTAVAFMIGSLTSEEFRSIVKNAPNLVWDIRDRLANRRGSKSVVPQSPDIFATIVSSFAPFWPFKNRPNTVTVGDRNAWDASEFLISCIDKLATDPTPAATIALHSIANVQSEYADRVRRGIFEQRQARANIEWNPYKVTELAQLVQDEGPVSHADFQNILLDELGKVQSMIHSSSEDVWQFFYKNGASRTPKLEDGCSDALVVLLRSLKRPITYDREKHLGNDREGDIWCGWNGFEIAIECKRHWHPHLWRAFDFQLAQQQAVDWRARGYGIYIVFWFGEQVHRMPRRGRGRDFAAPRTALELEEELTRCVDDAGLKTIAVKVLDISRSSS